MKAANKKQIIMNRNKKTTDTQWVVKLLKCDTILEWRTVGENGHGNEKKDRKREKEHLHRNMRTHA